MYTPWISRTSLGCTLLNPNPNLFKFRQGPIRLIADLRATGVIANHINRTFVFRLHQLTTQPTPTYHFGIIIISYTSLTFTMASNDEEQRRTIEQNLLKPTSSAFESQTLLYVLSSHLENNLIHDRESKTILVNIAKGKSLTCCKYL